MKKREKYCRNCGETFRSKRIDAKYCSVSCRGMGNRARKKPELYDGTMSVEFSLKPNEYLKLLKDGQIIGITPEDYAQTICKEFINNLKN
ncbi:MAG: hypothetical protein DRI89_13480 [Bacteroidetes bacterium]|nr:MAG: hypothetical protein DRI89_13480 [Bacteroidota bacterium]